MTGLRERLAVGGAIAAGAAAFAWLNGGTSVDVNLGLLRFRDVPLPLVVFSSVLVGMLTLFLASLKAEQRTERMLRRYREALGGDRAPPVDPAERRADADTAPDEA